MWYSYVYILVKTNISIIGHNIAQVTFKNYVPFINCVAKVDGTIIDNAKVLDLVMSTYKFLEYNQNYFDTTSSLWFYLWNEATNFNNDIWNTNKFKSFIYKAKLLQNTETDWLNGIIRNTAISVLLKYLSNFWRSLEMSLINRKVELKCKWMSHCILSAVGTYNDDVHPNNNILTIKDTQWYVPVVTLSAQENQKLKKKPA